ncbi:MAG: rhodanese-like domain-containing protein [Propionicimonas sp.]
MEETTVDVMHNGLPLATARQTTLGLYATAREAYQMLTADPETIRLLDVRSLEEYVFVGHAPQAWLVPLADFTHEWNAEGTSMRWAPRPDFVTSVQRWFAPDATVLVTCRSGGRSAMAINALAAAGFTRLYNVIDGMEGGLVDDPSSVHHGMRMKNGWRNSGLPWTYDLDPSRMMVAGEPG